MPQSAIIGTSTLNNRLIPLYPGNAKRIHVNLPPGATYPKGLVLGQVTGSGNAVQTVTVTGTPTGGTFTLTGTDPLSGGAFTTAPIAYNAAAAAVATAVQNALGNATVTGGGGALPGTAVTLTFSGAYAGRPVPVLALGTNALTGGTTPTVTVANTTPGRTAGTYVAYTDAGTNGAGSDEARMILEYTVTVRADGRMFIGTATEQEGEGLPSCPAYFSGDFKTTDLVGLTVAAVADLGRLVAGTVDDGILRIG